MQKGDGVERECVCVRERALIYFYNYYCLFFYCGCSLYVCILYASTTTIFGWLFTILKLYRNNSKHSFNLDILRCVVYLDFQYNFQNATHGNVI